MAQYIEELGNKLHQLVYKIPRWTDIVLLSAGTAVSYTIPANADILVIRPVLHSDGTFSPIYINVTGTAAAASAGVTDGSGSIPIYETTTLKVGGGETLSLIRIAATQVDVYLSAYSMNGV